jgi:hypothetical protein
MQSLTCDFVCNFWDVRFQVQKLLKEEPDITGKHPMQFKVEAYYHANHRVSRSC